MSISKNSQCPCGSGKLYKRCHGLFDELKKENQNSKSFFKNTGTIHILHTVAALTILPDNHGKNVRLEQIAKDALEKIQYKKERSSV